MSSRQTPPGADQFAQLSERALATNRRRANELAAQLDEILADGSTGCHPDRALALAHEIVGSAGTFGYSKVSDLARRVETLLVADDLTEAWAVTQQIRRALNQNHGR